jgi:hypothetical protein
LRKFSARLAEEESGENDCRNCLSSRLVAEQSLWQMHDIEQPLRSGAVGLPVACA